MMIGRCFGVREAANDPQPYCSDCCAAGAGNRGRTGHRRLRMRGKPPTEVVTLLALVKELVGAMTLALMWPQDPQLENLYLERPPRIPPSKRRPWCVEKVNKVRMALAFDLSSVIPRAAGHWWPSICWVFHPCNKSGNSAGQGVGLGVGSSIPCRHLARLKARCSSAGLFSRPNPAMIVATLQARVRVRCPAGLLLPVLKSPC
jgi:hypothetical protein